MSQSLRESVVQNLRLLRQRYFSSGSVSETEEQHDALSGFLERLPVDLQFLILTYLSPADLCLLGGTCHYWRGMVRDPLLWRFLLLRDIPFWKSIDHLSMPQLELLDAPLVDSEESLEDRVEGVDNDSKVDYMSEYLRGSPSCRQQWLPTSAPYKVVTSFFQSLVASAEPRYAMFGPGMEQLEVSFVTKLMNSPDLLPVSVSGTSHRKMHGIGSGITYLFDNQHKFNILTLYSTNRAERERARMQQQNVDNKLFTVELNAGSEVPTFSPTPHVQQVCQAVDGFIYVANAERANSLLHGICPLHLTNTSTPLVIFTIGCRFSFQSARSTPDSTHFLTTSLKTRAACQEQWSLQGSTPEIVFSIEAQLGQDYWSWRIFSYCACFGRWGAQRTPPRHGRNMGLHADGSENEPAQVRALLSSAWGSTSRPLLVLSCVSREEPPTPHRVPCIHMAKRLELAALENPWMVQDVAADSLSGLLDGLSWILRCSGVTLRSR